MSDVTSTCHIMMSTCQIKLLLIGQEHAFEVDQHSVLNGLNHAGSAPTGGTYIYHHEFRNCAGFPIFCLWAKILSSFQIKRFKDSYSTKSTHITKFYLCNFL